MSNNKNEIKAIQKMVNYIRGEGSGMSKFYVHFSILIDGKRGWYCAGWGMFVSITFHLRVGKSANVIMYDNVFKKSVHCTLYLDVDHPKTNSILKILWSNLFKLKCLKNFFRKKNFFFCIWNTFLTVLSIWNTFMKVFCL